MLVLALHTAYLAALIFGFARCARADAAGARRLRHLRVNAAQFLLKLRAARLQQGSRPVEPVGAMGLAQ